MVIVAGAAVVLVIAAIVTLRLKSRRHRRQETERLQGKFGSEYGSVVGDAGRKKGEAELAKREERVAEFNLRPLAASERERFTDLWTATQARFVDDPGGAISDADRILGEVILVRGYPVGDFEQRAADISVDHPEFVANYRSAHAQAVRHSHGEASTENLRQAMVQYRWLFNDLVASTDSSTESPANGGKA